MNSRDEPRESPLTVAARTIVGKRGGHAMFEILLRWGADVRAVGYSGSTAHELAEQKLADLGGRLLLPSREYLLTIRRKASSGGSSCCVL